MQFRAPSIQWPDRLEPGGPEDDPDILLTGNARMDGQPFVITAIRMREGMRMPDYRDGVDPGAYDGALDSLLDDIECLSSTIEPSLLRLDGGNYLMWMVPGVAEETPAQSEDEPEPA